MKTHSRLVFVLLAAALLSACAAKRMTSAQELRIRSIAIVNLVPEQANLEKIGLTVFNNEREAVDMGGRIGETILAASTKRLKVARGAWKIKDVSYDRASMYEKFTSGGMVMAYHEERIKKDLAELARANGLDAIIVVTSGRNERLQPDGVGVWMRAVNVSLIRAATVHANLAVSIVDANGEIMARAAVFEDARPIDITAYGIRYDLKENLRPEILDRLRPEIIDHLQGAIDRRFDQLKII